MKKFILITLALALTLSLAACSSSGSDSGKAEIKYSKSQGPYTELFEAAIVPILEEQGYTLTAVEASDLLIADQILQNDEVDVNVEQHTAYAENLNESNDGDLTPICPIPTVPAGVYSVNHTSLDGAHEKRGL